MIHAREDYNHIQDPSGKIPEDEPVFLLRGQDKFAPALLCEWAKQLMEAGGDMSMALEVVAHAIKMHDWQESVKKKIPDL